MILEAESLYHVYNQGNNKENIFANRDHYISFLKYARQFILPNAEVLSYCLMPNHFHFLINTSGQSIEEKKVGNITSTNIQNGYRVLQSSYTKNYNLKMNRSGSLFRQKIKFKKIDSNEYAYVCFNYIHQNPYVAGLCKKMEDWEFSSFRDYIGFRNGTFCNMQLAKEFIDLNENALYKDSYQAIAEYKIHKLY